MNLEHGPFTNFAPPVMPRPRPFAALAAAAALVCVSAVGCGGPPEGEITDPGEDVPSYEEQMSAGGYDANNRPEPER